MQVGKAAKDFLDNPDSEMIVSWRPKPGKGGEKAPRKRKQAPASRTNSKKRKEDPPPRPATPPAPERVGVGVVCRLGFEAAVAQSWSLGAGVDKPGITSFGIQGDQWQRQLSTW